VLVLEITAAQFISEPVAGRVMTEPEGRASFAGTSFAAKS